MKIRIEKVMNDDKKYPTLAGSFTRKYWVGSNLLRIDCGKKFKHTGRPILCPTMCDIPPVFIDRTEAALVLRHWRKNKEIA